MLSFAGGLLGLAVGLLAGLSESPLVATVLPLLFGTVGGAGGLYLARVDLGSPADRRRLRTLGVATSVLVLCLILGTFYAVALMIVGLQFGLVVGLVAGLLTFIPFKSSRVLTGFTEMRS